MPNARRARLLREEDDEVETVRRETFTPSDYTSALFCEHANECPHICPCRSNCYCKQHTCRASEELVAREVQQAEQQLAALPGPSRLTDILHEELQFEQFVAELRRPDDLIEDPEVRANTLAQRYAEEVSRHFGERIDDIIARRGSSRSARVQDPELASLHQLQRLIAERTEHVRAIATLDEQIQVHLRSLRIQT